MELAAAAGAGYVLLAGRYEGIDERLIAREVDEEIAIGDFVVSGGELPALMLIDAIVRQLPGVLNDAQSAREDSFADGLLDCPHYTRPEVYEGVAVPDVLLSGHHADDPPLAAASRRCGARGSGGRTCWRGRALTKEEAALLARVREATGTVANRRQDGATSARKAVPALCAKRKGKETRMNIIEQLEKEEIARLGKTIPEFAPGDTVIVNVNVVEGERKRVQAYEGVVIAKRNRGLNSSFTVRKISSGEGVERTFQTYSPLLASIEVKRRGDVRRAKLYYLRDRSGKSARIREKLTHKRQARRARMIASRSRAPGDCGLRGKSGPFAGRFAFAGVAGDQCGARRARRMWRRPGSCFLHGHLAMPGLFPQDSNGIIDRSVAHAVA